MNKRPELIVIMGPTGSGKSALALKIAEKLPCEIISADSMQVYRGMDIGTAKPTLEEQKYIKHHLIDILDIHERLDVFFYVEKAQLAIAEILEKKKIPLIVGGSGMYIRALLYGLDPLPSSPSLRADLRAKYEGEEGLQALISDIEKVDAKAVGILGKNRRKLIRALEVFLITGKSITQQQEIWEDNKLKYNAAVYFVTRKRAELFDRINLRAGIMLKQGWIEETENLVANGLLNTPTAWQAIGYNIIAKYLNSELDYKEMETRIVSATKKYARRQETWFNNQHPEAEKKILTLDNCCLSDEIINRFTS